MNTGRRENHSETMETRGKLMEREGASAGGWRNGRESANAGDSPTLFGQGNKGNAAKT